MYLLALLYAVLAGICLQTGFWGKGWIVLESFGWVSWWQAEKTLKQLVHRKLLLWRLLYAFVFLFTWNVVATWWVRITGALWVISIANSLVMLIPFFMYWYLEKFFTSKTLKWLWIPIWITFEFAHHHWQLTWVWLTLGNTFLYQNNWVQWYEYTGVWGGSLWVLLINVLIWELKESFSFIRLLWLTSAVIVPLLVSEFLQKQIILPTRKLEVVLVQPNINPFTEKFKDCPYFIPYSEQAQILVNLTLQKASANTDLVVFPETALDENFDERWLRKYSTFQKIDSLQQKLQVPIILGASTRIFSKERNSPTSLYAPLSHSYYEDFNTALLLKKDTILYYKKNILVPGVETIPFPEYTIFLKDFISDIGASFFLLGKGKELVVFPTEEALVAPIICYESMYGEHVAKFVQKGANLLCTITNDGWLGDTAWQRHHLFLGALRCIETRREMIHCSNMGASALIDLWGRVRSQISYNHRSALKGSIFTYERQTFYVLFGDIIARLCLGIVCLSTVWVWGKRFLRGKVMIT